ncbi:MAG: histidinol dehydrogenase [Anaerolineales bacterium]|nr:histidinol dehydrogenase [Anaerolineales bacterium]
METFHRQQPPTSRFTNEPGGTLGQIIRPIQRVGLMPGGTAPSSTVLTSAIRARRGRQRYRGGHTAQPLC